MTATPGIEDALYVHVVSVAALPVYEFGVMVAPLFRAMVGKLFRSMVGSLKLRVVDLCSRLRSFAVHVKTNFNLSISTANSTAALVLK